MESGYYAPGTEHNPSAPWNQSKNSEELVDCYVSTTLSKSVSLLIDDYVDREEYDADIDDEGHSYCNVWTERDYSECDFKGAYEKQEFTIPQLLDILKEYVKADLQDSFHNEPKYKLKNILEACSGWVEDELEVGQE